MEIFKHQNFFYSPQIVMYDKIIVNIKLTEKNTRESHNTLYLCFVKISVIYFINKNSCLFANTIPR